MLGSTYIRTAICNEAVHHRWCGWHHAHARDAINVSYCLATKIAVIADTQPISLAAIATLPKSPFTVLPRNCRSERKTVSFLTLCKDQSIHAIASAAVTPKIQSSSLLPHSVWGHRRCCRYALLCARDSCVCCWNICLLSHKPCLLLLTMYILLPVDPR